MPNPYFQFKQFTVYHDRCAMKVTTDSCLFGSWCAEEIKNDNYEAEKKNLLEVGAGSGLLSLMIAQKNNCRIEALEIDADAAQQAKQNILASPWKEQIILHHNDVLSFPFSHSYDIIVSNPPFYERELVSGNKQKNTAHHAEGLTLSELVLLVKQTLSPAGNFYLLLPYKRKTEAEKLLQKENLFIKKQVLVSQSVLHAPFRLMITGGHYKTEKDEIRISIKDANQQYTKEFIDLLQDYYLYL